MDYSLPEWLVDRDALDLIQRLLVKNPEERLGWGGQFNGLKKHPFFSGIDFSNLDKIEISIQAKRSAPSTHSSYESYSSYEGFTDSEQEENREEEEEEEEDQIILEGYLKKRNKFMFWQKKYFNLNSHGPTLKYS